MTYGDEFRKEFLENNPDKKIKILDYFANAGYGCHKARCTYTNNCTIEELVNYCDGGTGNYGGRIENEITNEDGTSTGTVVIYFD